VDALRVHARNGLRYGHRRAKRSDPLAFPGPYSTSVPDPQARSRRIRSSQGLTLTRREAVDPQDALPGLR
jgi:hypothetical protein